MKEEQVEVEVEVKVEKRALYSMVARVRHRQHLQARPDRVRRRCQLCPLPPQRRHLRYHL